jgi:hypothetical protein
VPNQFSHNRRWREEVIETASRLSLCVVLPEELKANTRIKSACAHGEVKETTVYRLIERQFCCKSEASKAADPSVRSHAANVRWVVNPHQPPMSDEHKRKIGETLKGVDNSFTPTSAQRLLPGTLYLVNYQDEDGDHIKVGITKRTVEERLKSRLVSVIVTHKATLGECFDLEQQFLEDFSEFRYSSSTTTELIQVDQLQKAIEYLKAYDQRQDT